MSNSRIKIMQITHDLNIGGLQRVVVDLATKLDPTIYDVSVCALREGGQLVDELKKNNIKVLKTFKCNNGTDYLTFWKLYKILRSERPHIIHTHNTQPFIEGGIAAWLAGIPMVHTEHGRQFPDKKRYMIAERIVSHYASKIVAVSESAKNDLIHYEKIKPIKIQVIINGIDESKYSQKIDQMRKKIELGINGNHSFIIGFAGRLSSEKGLIYLIQAMQKLVKDFPNILLLIAGEGILLEDLVNEINKMNLQNNIKFIGPRSDIYEIMGILDVFVLPSLREGLPLVLLEAAAAGLPIVASDVGGNKTVIKEGMNGLLVKPGDVDALHGALKYLFENRSRLRRYGEVSREIFQSHFTINKMLMLYENIYQHIIQSLSNN